MSCRVGDRRGSLQLTRGLVSEKRHELTKVLDLIFRVGLVHTANDGICKDRGVLDAVLNTFELRSTCHGKYV